MASLGDLSTELIQLIVTILMPQDAFNFAFTSKHMWQCCTTVIEEHKVLAEKYSECTAEECYTSGDMNS